MIFRLKYLLLYLTVASYNRKLWDITYLIVGLPCALHNAIGHGYKGVFV